MSCTSKFPRQSGILLHPSSLPGPYGIGSIGAHARAFVDFLADARVSVWQILPLGPTGYGDSPYQCFSAFAGNPYLIDLEELLHNGWLTENELNALTFPPDKVDFGLLIPYKLRMLRIAFERSGIEHNQDFRDFCARESAWLEDYSLFMALKEAHGGGSWLNWPSELRKRETAALDDFRVQLKEQVLFQKFVQFIFFRQWFGLKRYANERSVKMMGDIPLYVALDSADVWSNPACFMLDSEFMPKVVAGVPPDYFSSTGQLWGNPIYDWDYMKNDDFSWWKERMAANLKLYDMLRIDHFRGLEAFWAVPYGEDTAINGEWVKAPGSGLLRALSLHFENLPIVAEDLGVITDEVNAMREEHGLPSMKILQFAFDSLEGNNHSPHFYEVNSVVYTGTHDNDTLVGWIEKASAKDLKGLLEYIGADNADELHWKLIRVAYASVSSMAIIPIQDILGLGTSSRMNLPGSSGGNWQWRMEEGPLRTDLSARLAGLARIYDRSSSL